MCDYVVTVAFYPWSSSLYVIFIVCISNKDVSDFDYYRGITHVAHYDVYPEASHFWGQPQTQK